MNKQLILLTLLSFLLFFANIGGTSIYILDEAKNAGCAMEMYQRGDWIVPTFNGELRFDKPPLHYFFMGAAFSVFGITPFAARFFSAFMGVLLMLIVYRFAKRESGKQTAFLGCLVFLTSLQVCVQFHLAVPDPYLLFFLTAGFILFFESLQSQKAITFYLSYGCFALATLAKGPVALVLPGLIIFIFLWSQQKLSWGTIKRLHIPEGILLVLLIAVPWYWLVHARTDGLWTEQFFFTHNVGRFTKTMEGHGGFPLASVAIAFGALMPFSFFLPQAIHEAWRSRRKNPFLQFSLIASFTVILFFALSRTILPTYVGPALPFLALLLGAFFRKALKRRRIKMMPGAILYAFVACILPLAAYIVLSEDELLRSLAYLAGWFVLFPLSAFAGLIFINRKQIRHGLVAYATGNALFLLAFFYVISPKIDATNLVSKTLQLVKNKADINHYVGDFNPAFVFALQRPLAPLTDEQALELLRTQPLAVVVSQTRYSQALPDSFLIYSGKDLFEKQTTVVFRGK
jgi:4-amino-4-deoxy-L-arabinose transferase-like glycosyltransferase